MMQRSWQSQLGAGGMELPVLIHQFLLSQDLKPTSKVAYQGRLRQFLVWLNGAGLAHLTRHTLLAFKTQLQARGLSALTISSYLVAIRRLFEWTEAVGIYPNIAKGIRGTKRPWGFRKDPLTISQAKGLLNAIDRSTLRGQRNFALINLLLRTGLRVIEVVRANVGDIRPEMGQTVLWVHGKGRDAKDEFVVLTEETLMPLRAYLTERGTAAEAEPLFASLSDLNWGERLTTHSVSRIVKGYLRSIGLNHERLTAHSLRHTAITLALKGGATIQEAKALGRHANINTTLIYAHNIDRLTQAPERKIDVVLNGSGQEVRTGEGVSS